MRKDKKQQKKSSDQTTGIFQLTGEPTKPTTTEQENLRQEKHCFRDWKDSEP